MKKLIAMFGALLLTACASTIIVDPKGIDQTQYKIDYAECENLADQVGAGKQALKEGVFGAILYGALGVASSDDAGKMATIGAIGGVATGSSKGSMEKGKVLRNCLVNRGYTVLN